MSRANDEKTSHAKRTELRNRLIGEFLMESATADAWIKAWGIRAALAGIERGATYWIQAFEWIINEREPSLDSSGQYPAGWVEIKGQERRDRDEDRDVPGSSDPLPEPAKSPRGAHSSRRRYANRSDSRASGSCRTRLDPRSKPH